MSDDEGLYSPESPEGHMSSLVSVLAIGVGIVIGLAIDYAVWVAWRATKGDNQ